LGVGEVAIHSYFQEIGAQGHPKPLNNKGIAAVGLGRSLLSYLFHNNGPNPVGFGSVFAPLAYRQTLQIGLFLACFCPALACCGPARQICGGRSSGWARAAALDMFLIKSVTKIPDSLPYSAKSWQNTAPFGAILQRKEASDGPVF